MTHSIKHLFHINAPRSDVLKAISTIDGLSKWWTVQTTGNADTGGIIQFRFGDMGGPDMKVTGVKSNESITWECVASPHGWVGNTITIKLDDNEGKTRVRFSHDGWNDKTTFMPSVVSVGDDTWKVCGSFVKPEKVKHLEVKDTGCKKSKIN